MNLRVPSLTLLFAIAATAGCEPTPKEKVARCVEAVRGPINEAANDIDGWVFEPLALTTSQRDFRSRNVNLVFHRRFLHQATGEQLVVRIFAGHRHRIPRFAAWIGCYGQARSGISNGVVDQTPFGTADGWRLWTTVVGVPGERDSYTKECRVWGTNLGWNWTDPAQRAKQEARPLVAFAIEVVAPVEPQYSYENSEWRFWEMQWDRAEFSGRQLGLIETLLERIESPLAETFAVKDTFEYE